MAGPYAVITHASEETIGPWVTGPLADQTAGFVLIDHGPASGNIAFSLAGDQWPVPTGDTDETVLAILKLFWPPDQGAPTATASSPGFGQERRAPRNDSLVNASRSGRW